MIRAALLLCAGIIIATCFACVPAPPQMVGSAAPPAPGTGTGNQNCTAADFAAGVQVLQAAYNPTAPTPPPSSIATVGVGQNTPIWNDLVAAFGAAPSD